MYVFDMSIDEVNARAPLRKINLQKNSGVQLNFQAVMSCT